MQQLSFYVNKKICYVNLVWTNNQRIYLKLVNGQIILSLPTRTSLDIARRFVSQHLNKFLEKQTISKTKQKFNFEKFLITLKDKTYNFKILTGFVNSKLLIKNEKIYFHSLKGTQKEVETILKDYLKKELEKYLTKRLPTFIKLLKTPNYNFKVVYKTSTWATNNLSQKMIIFSSRLSYYQNDVIDYVIVHELTHHFYPHHQKSFWKFLAKFCPQYLTIKNQLKDDY